MHHIKVEVVKIGGKVPDLQWRWRGAIYKILWGLWLGICIAWCGPTPTGFLLAGFFGVMLGCFAYGQDLWKRRANWAAKNHMELIHVCNERAKADLDAHVRQMMDHFFEGSPIQNYTIRLDENGLVIKVGDDDCMVPVDMAMLGDDPIAALERARIEWMSAKANLTDLGNRGD